MAKFINRICKFMNAPVTVTLTLFCIYWYSTHAFALLYANIEPREIIVKIHLVGEPEVVKHSFECSSDLEVKLDILENENPQK